MERSQSVLERFPSFYKTWDSNSLIYKLVVSMGKRLDEADIELREIMRSHWVDTSYKGDLDGLGCIFNVHRKPEEADDDYRIRLKRAIIEYKGGGTINAILTSLRMTLGLPGDYPIELIENPPIEVYREFLAKPGDTWEFNSESVLDAVPTIEISIDSEGEKITNPTVISIDTGESITFNGIIKKDELLEISQAGAKLGGKSVTSKLSVKKPPTIVRKLSQWSYNEPISEEIGIFDVGVFDQAKFAVGITTVKVGFRWTAQQPATFEIRLPKDAVKDRIDLAREAVDAIKATGVKALIKVV